MAQNKKKILILGGFGFLGQNLNNELNKTNSFEIHNESRRTGCDILNYEQFKAKIKEINPDWIVNASAHVGSIRYVIDNAATVMNDNTQMYLNLYKAVAEVNPKIKVLNVISNCSYPGIIDIQHEKDWWNGDIHESVMSYGNAKKAGYILSKCYRNQHGIKTTNLIMANSYGPNDYTDENRTHAMNGMIMRMIKAKRNNDKSFLIWGTGTVLREWIYMPDMARIINVVLTKDNDLTLPDPLNVGIGKGVSIKESANTIKELLNYDCEFIFDTSKPDGAPIKILGVNAFNSIFRDFKFTSYEEGIKETIKYYENKL